MILGALWVLCMFISCTDLWKVAGYWNYLVWVHSIWPYLSKKNIHRLGSKWSIILNAHIVLGIWPIIIRRSWKWNLIIIAWAITVILAVRKAVLSWIPLKGPEEVETPYDLTSKAAWGCVNSKDSPRRCHGVLVIIREVQFMVRWTEREARILLWESTALKVVPSHSEIIMVQTDVGCLPARAGRISIFVKRGRQWLV